MESAWELKLLADELARGMEKAVQLRLHLSSTSRGEAQDLLLPRIISSFEKALHFLSCSGHVPAGEPSPAAPESPASADGSSGSDDHNHGDAYKKRKLQHTWTEQVKVNSQNGLEGPGDDGYSWRKYGQKDILGAKYPRSYYRCTYRLGRNCLVTKQVQRSDEDPNLFEITYKGTHTCKQFKNTAPPPASAEKQELKYNSYRYDQLEQSSNVKSNLRVNTEVSDIQEMPAHFSFPSTISCHENENRCSPISTLTDDHHLRAYSLLFNYPATSTSGTYQMRDYGGVPMQHSETDIADIMSAHESTTNSPTGGMEFSIPVEIEPDFPFNISAFFT